METDLGARFQRDASPKPGTPVFIVGRYDFDAAPPWRSFAWLSTTVELPAVSMIEIDTP